MIALPQVRVTKDDKPDKPRKVALGPALDTPDEELDMAALVTPQDIEAAKADMVARGSKRLKALLEAARVEPPEGDNAVPLGV